MSGPRDGDAREPLNPVWSRGLRRAAPIAAIVLLAVVLREIPSLANAAWGNDFGIYLGLTERMVQTGQLFPAYDGWGSSYQYFPTLYLVTAGAHVLTGADVMAVLLRVAGVIGGLIVLLFFLTAMELFRSRRLALLAALILAVDPNHIYATAHSAPLVMGHLGLVLVLWLFVRWRRGASWVPLVPASLFLLMSHHLGTYFLILAVAGIAVGSRLLGRSDDRRFRLDLLFLAAFLAAAFAYWGWVATPVMGYALTATGLPGPLALGALLGGVLLAERLVPRAAPRVSSVVKRSGGWIKPGPAFATMLLFGLALILLNIVVRPWGDRFALPPHALLVLLPPLLVTCLAAAGLAAALKEFEWSPVLGLLVLFSLSLLFAFVTASQFLISFRHLEYLSLPIALLAASALLRADPWIRAYLARTRPAVRSASSGRVRAGVVAATVAILLTNVASGYGVTNGTLGFDERIPDVSWALVEWMSGALPNNGTVAADHRMSQMLWARGFHPTNDDAVLVWTDTNRTLIETELRSFTPRVDYVFVDYIMVESGIQSGTNTAPPKMTAESLAKFQDPPFRLVHRIESPDGSRWAEVYAVEW